jgi:hypothetical protein
MNSNAVTDNISYIAFGICLLASLALFTWQIATYTSLLG